MPNICWVLEIIRNEIVLLLFATTSPLLLFSFGYHVTPVSANESSLAFNPMHLSLWVKYYYFCKIFADRFIMKIIIACSISLLSASSFSNMHFACLNVKVSFSRNKFSSHYKFHLKSCFKTCKTYNLIWGSQTVSFQRANSLLCSSSALFNSSSSHVRSSPTSTSYLWRIPWKVWIALSLILVLF